MPPKAPTKQNDAPKFGSDFVEKLEAFEALCFERFNDGCSVDDCLQPHEQSAATITFGWDEQKLRRRVLQLSKVHRAKYIIGTAKGREEAEQAEKKAVAAEQKLLDEHAEIRRQLDKKERAARAECVRLSKMNDGIRGGLALLRSSLPQHIVAELNAAQGVLARNAESDLAACKNEIAYIETILGGPKTGPGVNNRINAELMWIDQVKRIDRQFVSAEKNSRGGWHTTPKFDAWKAEQEKRLPLLREDLEKLEQAEKECEKHEAKLESRRDYYLD